MFVWGASIHMHKFSPVDLILHLKRIWVLFFFFFFYFDGKWTFFFLLWNTSKIPPTPIPHPLILCQSNGSLPGNCTPPPPPLTGGGCGGGQKPSFPHPPIWREGLRDELDVALYFKKIILLHNVTKNMDTESHLFLHIGIIFKSNCEKLKVKAVE